MLTKSSVVAFTGDAAADALALGCGERHAIHICSVGVAMGSARGERDIHICSDIVSEESGRGGAVPDDLAIHICSDKGVGASLG